MSSLALHLLGPPRLERDGEPLELQYFKNVALLAFLAVTGETHTRESLITLLWPELEPSRARANLRRNLSLLRKALNGEWLLVDREMISLDPESEVWVDVDQFQQHLMACETHGHPPTETCPDCIPLLEETVALYRDHFLAGFSLRDSAAFDDWQFFQTEGLKDELAGALVRLATYQTSQGDFDAAIGHARRWLALDPLHEPAHRHLMVLYTKSGQRAAALRQYETCRQPLADELGVEPAERTQETYQRLLKGELLIGPTTVEAILERELRTVGECPYRGLSPFREADAPFFFGRESFAERLVEAVRTQPMVAVIVGSSGSGKSSAVFAGLLPQLRGEGNWLIAGLRPGGQPFHALAAALLPILEPELRETERLVETRKLAQALIEQDIPLPDVIARILNKHPQANQVLLVIDQFEELYSLCPDPATRHAFIDLLLQAIPQSSDLRIYESTNLPASPSPLHLLLTMRADFMGQALTHRPFVDALQESSLLLGPMTREELGAAIEKPAEKQGAALEAGLVERLLDAVGQEPGNLPLLEFALTLLWERLDYGWMTHRAYEDIGRVEGALARYAQQVYEELKEEERERARRVFVQLVQPGEGTEDTRRVATRAELGDDPVLGGQDKGNWGLVQHLADRRLVVTGRDSTSGSETVEVVHEALIQRWGQLRSWIEEDRAFRTWQERLRAALRQWQATEQDEGVLLRGAPLTEAESWLADREAELSAGEIQFIQASVGLRDRQAAEREVQRQRELTQISIGLASQALLELEGPFSERAVPLALEALESYSYTSQAERALSLAVLGSRLRLILQHATRVHESQWSPDGMRILTASYDGTAQIWDAAASSPTYDQKLLTLSGHKDVVWSAVWSPTGDRILTCSFDRTVRVWDASSSSPTYGEELLRITGHSEIVNSAWWSPDGTRILTASDDGTAKVWHAITGENLLTLSGHEDYVQSAVWSPLGDRILTASGDYTAKVWDAITGDLIITLSSHTSSLECAAWSPDGSRMVTGSTDGTARVWDAITGAETLIFSGHKVPIYAVAWSPDGSRIATGGRDAIARVWNATTGAEILALHGHTANISGIAWSPDGSRIVTASVDGTAKVWDLDPALLTIAGPEGPLVPVAWSPTGDRLARGFKHGIVKVWNAVTGEETVPFAGHSGGVIHVAWSPSGDRLATACLDGTAKVWDANTGEEIFTLLGHSGQIMCAKWSPDGTRIVSAGTGDSIARIWDTDTGAETFVFTGHDGGATSAEWSPDGRTITSSSQDGTLKIWDPTTDQVIRDIHPAVGYGVSIMRWSPDGTRIATWTGDGIGRIWDVIAGEETISFSGHTGDVWCVGWSPTGERILTSGGDGRVRVWDAATGAELLRYELGNGLVAVWSPDGIRIAVASTDGSLKVLPTWQTTQELIDYARECCFVRELTDEEREQFGLGPR